MLVKPTGNFLGIFKKNFHTDAENNNIVMTAIITLIIIDYFDNVH